MPGITADDKPRDIRSVGIIGSGTMGGGIAMAFANAGIAVVVLDIEQAALARGLRSHSQELRIQREAWPHDGCRHGASAWA